MRSHRSNGTNSANGSTNTICSLSIDVHLKAGLEAGRLDDRIDRLSEELKAVR